MVTLKVYTDNLSPGSLPYYEAGLDESVHLIGDDGDSIIAVGPGSTRFIIPIFELSDQSPGKLAKIVLNMMLALAESAGRPGRIVVAMRSNMTLASHKGVVHVLELGIAMHEDPDPEGPGIGFMIGDTRFPGYIDVAGEDPELDEYLMVTEIMLS